MIGAVVQTRLKLLLVQRHWQTYRTFCSEYERAATFDKHLAGSAPSRAQFFRWMKADVQSTPHPDACRVLEAMFPGWKSAELLELVDEDDDTSISRPDELAPKPAGPALNRALNLNGVREKRVQVEIDVQPNGDVSLTYEHEIENSSSTPYSRFIRDLWFAVVSDSLAVEAVPGEEHDFIVQRLHETPAHLTYACQFLPPLPVGETATVKYRCVGAVFGKDHYWRQSIVNPVDKYLITVRIRDVIRLTQCSATEERADGSAMSADETMTFRRDGSDVILTLTRKDLRPNQFVTLRWDFPRATP